MLVSVISYIINHREKTTHKLAELLKTEVSEKYLCEKKRSTEEPTSSMKKTTIFIRQYLQSEFKKIDLLWQAISLSLSPLYLISGNRLLNEAVKPLQLSNAGPSLS